MIKDYKRAEPILNEEDKLDLLNTNVAFDDTLAEEGETATTLIPYSLFTTGFINIDLVALQDKTVLNCILLPDEALGGGEIVGYDKNTQREKALVVKSYTDISDDLLGKMPKFSIKENFTMERNGIEIMQNVIRRVTEVQALDAQRIPLLIAAFDAVVSALDGAAGYTDSQGKALNLNLTPALIKAVGDAAADFSDKDSEMRTVLDELSQEVQTFINNTEGES